MKAEFLQEDNWNALIAFNHAVYPNKTLPFLPYFEYKFREHPLAEEQKNPCCLVVKEDNQGIVGQFNLLPCRYSRNGQPENGAWGMDYIVEETYRNGAAGMLLARKALKTTGHFGVGLSPASMKMHLAFGEKKIGTLKKYFRPNLTSLLSQPFKRKKNTPFQFPARIKMQGQVFYLWNGNNEEEWNRQGYWNKELIEFNRNHSFCTWRYGASIAHQALYIAGNHPAKGYFAVRTGTWKGRSVLVLNDYRFSLPFPGVFTNILRALQQLVKQGSFGGVLTTSSLHTTDVLLRKNAFFQFGNERAVVTNIALTAAEEAAAKKRNLLLVTLADSDSDFSFTSDRDFNFEARSVKKEKCQKTQ